MLTIALFTLFAVTTISVLCSLTDSALRAWNAYRELVEVVGKRPEGAKVHLIQHAEMTELPALRSARPYLVARTRIQVSRPEVSAVA